jgi:hypothetical protein
MDRDKIAITSFSLYAAKQVSEAEYIRSQVTGMHPLLVKLQGGDRRSIGQSDEVVAVVIENPGLFSVLVEGLDADDTIVRMRAADAMEKITALHPEYLAPHKKLLIALAAISREKEVRWHLAQMLPRLKLNRPELQHVVGILMEYFDDSSSIVKTLAMQALADFAHQAPALRQPVLLHLKELTLIGTPAMKARGRKLCAELERLPPP